MKEFLNKRNIINLLLLGIMVLAIPLTVKLARQQQILFSRAAAAQIVFLTKDQNGTTTPDGQSCVTTRNIGGSNKLVTLCPNVKIRFIAPTEADIKFIKTASLLPQGGLVSKVYAQATCSEGGQTYNEGDYFRRCKQGTHCVYDLFQCGANDWEYQGEEEDCNRCSDTRCTSDGSCSAATPACGQTTEGKDNCGNSCTKTGDACPEGSTCTEQAEDLGNGCAKHIRTCPGQPDEVSTYDISSGGECTAGSQQGGPAVDCTRIEGECKTGGFQYCVPNNVACGDDRNKCYSAAEGGEENKCSGADVGGTTACYLKGGNIDPASADQACKDNHPGSPGKCDPNEAGPYGDGCVGPAGGPSGGDTKCTTGSADNITQSQADCVINKRSDILPFYKNNGWCTNKKSYYPGIVNNWRTINGPNEDQILTDCGIDKGIKCTTGSAGEITANQASCVIGKKEGLLDFYKNNGWCTDKASYFPGIVNNWKGIITTQSDKDILTSCAAGGGPKKCFVCVNVAGKGNVWRYEGDSRGQTPTGDPNATCTDAADSCSSTKTGTCKGDVTGFLDKPCGSPGQTITKYRFAEDKTDLENPEKAKEGNYQAGGVDILHTFSNTPGEKFIWYQFGDGAGNWTEARSDRILLVGAEPKVTGAACNIHSDIRDNSLIFEIRGENFGDQVSTVSADGGTLEGNCKDCTWSINHIIARMVNPPDTTIGRTYNVIVNRADGIKSPPKTCQVETHQVSVGSKIFCQAPNSFDQQNVNLSIFEMVGVGSTGPSSSQVANKTTEKITVNKQGVSNKLKTNLNPKLEYIFCVEAPDVYSLEVCSKRIKVVAGNNAADLDIPIGDYNRDGKVGLEDASLLKSQFGPMIANKICDLNRDKICNSHEWSCIIKGYNKPSDQKPL